MSAAPCPGCDADPDYLAVVWDLGMKGKHQVRCTSCGAMGPAGETRAEAWDRWGRMTKRPEAARKHIEAANRMKWSKLE